MGEPHYELIDWSREGRARLVAQRGDEIRALLWFAFGSFCERRELGPFGFHGEDPIEEAVKWSIRRFETGEFASERCTPTFRIFTEVRFWLAQKVGVMAYRRIMRTRAEIHHADPPQPPRESNDGSVRSENALDEMRRHLATTLQQLATRTCSDLVGYWLGGTRRLRSAWFGWNVSSEIDNASASKKQRSFHAHDAMFRYQCLHQGLIPDADGSDPMVAVRESMFRPCENRPPYRRPDEEVAPLLPSARVTGPRSVGKLRRAKLAAILGQLFAFFDRDAKGEQEALERVFLRASLSATTIHALDLERRDDLLTRVKSLPPAESLVPEEP